MRKGIIVSAALHVGVIGAAMITWPNALSQSEEALPTVPIELVTLADATNIQATVREIEPPREFELPEFVPEPVAMPEPVPMAVPELAEPLPPEPEPLPEPEPEVAEAEPEPAPQPPPPPPPPPREKPPEAEEEFDLDSVIALLDRTAPASPPPERAQQAEETRRGIGDRSAMTMNLSDFLRAQMAECWNVPVGAPNPEELIVVINISLTPTGALARPPQPTRETLAAAARNPYVRATMESALRAIQLCAPYSGLPREQYADWRDVEMQFDPAAMVGR